MTNRALNVPGARSNTATGLPENFSSWGSLAMPSTSQQSPSRNALIEVLMTKPERRPTYLEDFARANFEQELQKPYWTAQEAVALLLGLHPVFLPPDLIAQNEFHDSVAREAMRLHRLVARAQELQDIPAKFRPAEFLNWSLRQHIAVPEYLLMLAIKRGFACEGYPCPTDILKAENRKSADIATAKIKDLEQQRATLKADLERLERDLNQSRNKTRIAELTLAAYLAATDYQDAQNAAPQENQSSRLGAATRKYNVAAKLLYGLAKQLYDVDFTKGSPVKLSKIVDDLHRVGIHVDDETLQGHLLAGSEQAAKV